MKKGSNKNKIIIFNSKFDEIEKSFDSKVDTIYDEINDKISKQKEFVLSKIPDLYQSIEEINSKYNELLGTLNSFGKLMDEKIANSQKESDQIIKKYFEDIENDLENFKVNVSKYDATLKTLEQKYEENYSMNLSKFNALFENYNMSVNEKLQSFINSFDNRLKATESNLLNNINEFTVKIDSLIGQKLGEDDQKLDSIINNLFMRSHEKEKEIEDSIVKISSSVNEIEKQSNEIKSDISVIFETYQQKIAAREDDTMKKLSNMSEEIESIKMRTSSFASEIEKKLEETGNSTISTLEEKIRDVVANIEKEYRTQAIENYNQLKQSYGELLDKKNEMEKMIENLSSQIDSRVSKILHEKEMDIMEIISKTKDNLKSSIESVLSTKDILLDQFKTDLSSLKNNAKNFENALEGELQERISIFSEHIEELEKEVEKLERKNAFMNEISKNVAQIDELLSKYQNQIDVLQSKQVETAEFIKSFDGIDKDLQEYSKKIFELRNERKTLARLEETFDRLVVLSAKADNQFAKVQNDMASIDNFKDKISELEIVFRKVNEKFGVLEQYDLKLTEMNENIQKLDNIIKMMIGEANELNEKVENTKMENKELHEKVLDFEKDFLKIQRESSKFDNVLEKFSQLDSLIIDIESRNKQLEQKQIQFAKTEDRLGKLIKNAEDLIEQLDLLRPIYKKTACYGHFGRTEPEFTWEKTDKADILKKEAGLK